MKKHDEGYVLAYVTVVLLIFCLVATTILTGALHNLQSQQKAIARMQDQYAAEGMIEKVVAQRDVCTFSPDQMILMDGVDTGVKWTAKDDTTVTLYAESGTVSVTCQIQLSGGEYISYEVSTVEPTPTESGGGSE